MGLIPRIESVQDFCSQTDIDSFRRFRCIGLAAELNPGESLPEVCEGLVKSMSARINSGAVGERCDSQQRAAASFSFFFPLATDEKISGFLGVLSRRSFL